MGGHKRAMVFWGSMVAWGLLASNAGSVAAQSILYDKFRAALRLDLWSGEQIGVGGLELVRTIQDGRLILGHRVLGETTQSTGRSISSNRLRFQAGQTLTAVSFDVIMQNYKVQGCATEGKFSRSVAGFTGAMFTNSKGAIGADLWVLRDSDSEDPPNRLRVLARLVQCVATECVDEERDLGTVALGEPTTLRVRWEELNGRIRFQKNDESPVFVRYTPEEVIRRLQTKVLTLVGNAANCTDGSHPVAAMTASFDNVFYNP
jgi:hypothetical protein